MTLRILCTSILLALAWITQSPAQAAVKHQIDIPAQELGAALAMLAKQAKIQVVYSTALVEGQRAHALSGSMTPEEALGQLLDRTGLKYEFIDAQTVTLSSSTGSNVPPSIPASGAPLGTATAGGVYQSRTRLAQNESSSQGEAVSGKAQSTESPRRDESLRESVELGEVVVTGSHIRGADVPSPVLTITPEEMRLAGHNNLGEALRALPQNFAGGQNPGVTLAATVGGGVANQNVTGASSINLRGLGPDATLTLLNGTRFPYDGLSQAIDVSVIPLPAIERVEVLLDGASAIYGSDAVGGVANIVLKRDYDGAELSARFGGATDGGYELQQYTAVAGTHWDSGGFLVTGDYSHNGSVEVSQRDYLSQLTNQNRTIYPQLTQEGALLSGHQQIDAFAELRLDAFYTDRSQETLDQTSAASFFVSGTDSSIWGAAPALDFALPGEWSARVHGAVGRNETETASASFSVATGAQTAASRGFYLNEMQAAGIEAEGPLFALRGGQARLSVGGGYRRNTFDRGITNLVTGVVFGVATGEESGRYVYGEVNLPLISEDQDVPLMTRLSLNAALRHEEYDSFDAATTPKIGAIWGVAPGFDLKASWGSSYKIPTQFQQHTEPLLVLDGGATYGRPAGSQVLRLGGGNPDLDPEEAETITAGIVARPEFLPGLTLEFGYFDIDYTDRVAFPIDVTSQALSNPVFAEFVTISPSTAQQNAAFATAGRPVGTFTVNNAGAPYNSASVVALVDNRYTNVSTHRVKGVDLIAHYTMDLFGGDLSLSGNGNWITRGTRKLTELASERPVAGVGFWPAKFKGRLGTGWSRQGFTSSANVYHTAGITDRSVTPNVKRDSMTTVDLIVDYQWDSDLLGDVGFNLTLTNVFDEPPPFLQPPALPTILYSYDSTNYSALGRVVSATIIKRF